MIDFKEILTMDKWLQGYLILTILDFLTGFIKAFKVEGFKSSKLRSGIANTALELLLLLFSAILDQLLGLEILLISTKMLFVFKECISIIENAGVCGVTLPAILLDKIQDLNPNKDKEGE